MKIARRWFMISVAYVRVAELSSYQDAHHKWWTTRCQGFRCRCERSVAISLCFAVGKGLPRRSAPRNDTLMGSVFTLLQLEFGGNMVLQHALVRE